MCTVEVAWVFEAVWWYFLCIVLDSIVEQKTIRVSPIKVAMKKLQKKKNISQIVSSIKVHEKKGHGTVRQVRGSLGKKLLPGFSLGKVPR
jgi:hypothetical protein